MEKEAVLLDIDHVSLRFGGVLAVNDLSLQVEEGSITGLIGPNGAGKTTVFNIISGFYAPDAGSVCFAGKAVEGLPPYRICREGIARTFQNIRLFSTATALENVMVGAHLRQKNPWWLPIFPFLSSQEEDAVRASSLALLDRVGLAKLANTQAGAMPYGDQRRLEIARALATGPRFLLLDEPAAGMNPQESMDLMAFLHEICREFQLTVLLIEHDMKVVMGVCSYIWVMEYGQCIAAGTPEAVRNNAAVIEAYLGEEYLRYA